MTSLNSGQKRHIRSTLYSFERALRRIDQLLNEGDERGILYHRKLRLSPIQSQAAHEKVIKTLQELAVFARQLKLEQGVEDPARMIMAEMSVCWADLEDCRPERLRNYGELDPEEAQAIDPMITNLANAAIELMRIIPVDPDHDPFDQNIQNK